MRRTNHTGVSQSSAGESEGKSEGKSASFCEQKEAKKLFYAGRRG
jgi:hypothetical protein